MEAAPYETVYTITDWYDGARAGIADFGGKPHYYQCQMEEGQDEDYLLNPLDAEAFQLEMEDWAIWLRWEEAFHAGLTTQETHPALPQDERRHKELIDLLAKKSAVSYSSKIKASAHFVYGKTTLVKWTLR